MKHTAITTRQFAELLGVHPHTVKRKVAAGVLPKPIPMGRGAFRWNPDVVQQFLNDGLTAPVTPATEGGERV